MRRKTGGFIEEDRAADCVQAEETRGLHLIVPDTEAVAPITAILERPCVAWPKSSASSRYP